jgi:hypothetical protein
VLFVIFVIFVAKLPLGKSMKSTPALARIAALHQERRALWDSGGKFSQAERGRLLDIAQELESLWNKRRMEIAGVDPERLPDVIVHDYEPDARRTRWARGRGRAKQGAARERAAGFAPSLAAAGEGVGG